MISREEAKEKILAIVANDNPIKTGQTLPIKIGQTFKVYKIPLDLLVPNVLNDRITWKIRSYESENNRSLDISLESDVDYLYDLIEMEHPKDNQKTLSDIAQNGQIVDGVITNEGIIIDGNRRATLLRKLFKGKASEFKQNSESFRYFNAIVLPEDVSPTEIMALETKLQLGADQKVSYNPICIYIKVDNLIKAGVNHDNIKEYMGLKSSKNVDEKIEVFKVMLEYLEFIGKPNQFYLLDKLEDQFINTKKVFKRLDSGNYNVEWECSKADISNFKEVCYDYMRSKFEGKKYRDILIGRPHEANGVFVEENVWRQFYKNHENIIENSVLENESDWKKLGENNGKLEKNLNSATQHLKDFLSEKTITKIIRDIRGKLERLENLLDDKEEMNDNDVKDLNEIEKSIYRILKDFK